MNTTKRTVAVLATTAVLGTGAALTASALTSGAPGSTTGTAAVATSLTSDVTKRLQLTREEERMARDLYAALAKAHDDALPMSMITVSEDRHYDAVGMLLTRYGVSDPSAGRKAGDYAYPELQKLYNQWYAKGEGSLNASYQVGAELERWDIAGLQKDVAATPQTDVKQLYSNLLTASQHHLSIYQAAASGQSVAPGTGNGWRGMGSGMGQGMRGGMYGIGGSQEQGRGQTLNGGCPMFDGDE
jgi:hypothetical protein